jgi:uncharacterized membrane protein HdeD (DUF308 family)
MSTTSATGQNSGWTPRSAGIDELNVALVRNWWLIALRGVLAIVFGIIALAAPLATILALVLLFSAYMLLDAVFSFGAAIRAARRGERWGLLSLLGFASFATGVVALIWPGITVAAFVLLIGAWAIVTGMLLLATAFRVNIDHGRWWLGLGGGLSMLYGLVMVVAPLAGAIVLTWWLGAFALVLGVALLIVAFRLRSRRADHPANVAAQPLT